jgi:hypothetical protein
MRPVSLKILLPASLLACSALLTTGCSDAPAPAKKAAVKKAPTPVTGQSGLFQTFQLARRWAPDAQIMKAENGNLAEAPSADGKCGLWRVTYVSETQKLKREFYYAVATSDGGVVEGARPGTETGYAPSPRIHIFPIADVRIDTPVALETANKEVAKDKAMSKILAEDKNLPVQFELESSGNEAKPTWRVIYGATISQSKFSILVDAKTGAFIKKLN